MTTDNLCNSCTNIGCEFQSGIIRTKCAFYMPPKIEPDNCGNYVVQDSTANEDTLADFLNKLNDLASDYGLVVGGYQQEEGMLQLLMVKTIGEDVK